MTWRKFDDPRPVPVVACYAMDRNGRFPILHRSAGVRSAPNCWSIPSGLHECGKTLGEQMAAELGEELSLDADPNSWQILTAYDNMPGDSWHWCLYVGVIRVHNLNFVNREPDKHSEVRICNPGDVLSRTFYDGFHESAQDALGLGEVRRRTFDLLIRQETKKNTKFCHLPVIKFDRSGTVPKGIKCFAEVDEEDIDSLMKNTWFLLKDKKVVRSVDRRRLECEVLGLDESYSEFGQIDHIDGNSLNCRRSNLRVCSPGENSRNKKSRGGSSQYKGVAYWERDSNWRAYINLNRRRTYLGYFRTEEEAALAYDAAARALHREFARLNFPRPGEQGAL